MENIDDYDDSASPLQLADRLETIADDEIIEEVSEEEQGEEEFVDDDAQLPAVTAPTAAPIIGHSSSSSSSRIPISAARQRDMDEFLPANTLLFPIQPPTTQSQSSTTRRTTSSRFDGSTPILRSQLPSARPTPRAHTPAPPFGSPSSTMDTQLPLTVHTVAARPESLTTDTWRAFFAFWSQHATAHGDSVWREKLKGSALFELYLAIQQDPTRVPVEDRSATPAMMERQWSLQRLQRAFRLVHDEPKKANLTTNLNACYQLLRAVPVVFKDERSIYSYIYEVRQILIKFGGLNEQTHLFATSTHGSSKTALCKYA
jgi:hypothetical protein